MKPALTKEEWKTFLRYCKRADAGKREGGWQKIGFMAPFFPHEPHKLAALCLHNQPFGFTREDVKLLRAFANLCTSDFRNLADRIEALLPPEEE